MSSLRIAWATLGDPVIKQNNTRKEDRKGGREVRKEERGKKGKRLILESFVQYDSLEPGTIIPDI